MMPYGMRLPWTGVTVPHATLDILRGCNVQCPGCYNVRAAALKPWEQIKAELDELLRLRRLQAVTLLGGEPTLHPDLLRVVEYAASKQLRVALLSNGVRLDAPAVRRLKDAGLTVLYLHIQEGQVRPDLEWPSPPERVRALRREKTELLARHKVQVGWSIMAYRPRLDELQQVIEDAIASPVVTYVLVTGYTDPWKFGRVQGNLAVGLSVARDASRVTDGVNGEETTAEDMLAIMDRQGTEPFAYLGSSRDAHEPRWLLYRFATLHTPAGGVSAIHVRCGLSDRLFVRLARWCRGRYVFFHKTYPGLVRIQLLLNALTGGRLTSTLRVVARSCRRAAQLRETYVLFQQGPTIGPDGQIVLCRECPDATVIGGRLVPVCLADWLERRSRGLTPDVKCGVTA